MATQLPCNLAERLADGIFYFPRFMSCSDADDVLEQLMFEVEFTQRSRKLYGRAVSTPRQEAWFGPNAYRFGGSALPPAEMPASVKSLAIRSEMFVNDLLRRHGAARFESCLVNRYRDGQDSVSWHADDEPEMGDPIIASVSLGAPRDFLLRRKDQTHCRAPSVLPAKLRVKLSHGSMLVMLRGVQAEWLHALPKRPSCTKPRVNLTFRDCRPV